MRSSSSIAVWICCLALVAAGAGAARGQGAAAPLGLASRWASDIDKKSYPPLPAPPTPPLLRWKLSPAVDHPYDYRQEVHALHQMSTVSDTQDVTAHGTLTVHADGDNSKVLITDVEARLTEQQHGTGDDKPHGSEAEVPPVDLPNFEADGQVASDDSAWSPMLRLVFPLPPTALAVGGTADIPMRVPLKVMGAAVYASGTAHVTLRGWYLLAGRACARLEAIIDLDKVDLPDEVARNYAVRVRGRAVGYFDAADGCFCSGELALLSSLHMSMLAPGAPPGHSKGKLVPPTTATYVDDSDTHLILAEKK